MSSGRSPSYLLPLGAILLVASLAAYAAYLLEDTMAFVASLLVGGLGGVWGVLTYQRLHLERTRLFKELFTEFNARYDALNERLAELRESDRPLTVADRRLLADYFNLCAEEYLFVSRACIDPRVWRSWCAGMLWYLEHPPIRAEWERESRTASHYGLTLDAIRQAGHQG